MTCDRRWIAKSQDSFTVSRGAFSGFGAIN